MGQQPAPPKRHRHAPRPAALVISSAARYGDKQWYQNGRLHRTDGPARERANGDREWCKNGRLHRIDGPAVEWASGTKEWRQNGHLHRTDGPALEWADGTKEWWLRGIRYDPAGPTPVVLAVDTDETGWGLLRVGTRYLAGCRNFAAVEDALAHWRPQGTPRARLFVPALEEELKFRSPT